MPGKGIDAQGILLGTGLSSYLYLIWLLQQWDKADDLFPNLPRGAVALFSDKTLPYPALRLSVVYSMYCFPSKCFVSQRYVPPQGAVSGTAGFSELPRSWEGHGAVSGRGLVARELRPARLCVRTATLAGEPSAGPAGRLQGRGVSWWWANT